MLAHSCVKCIIAGDEALQRIVDQGIEFRYQEFPQLFEKWWDSLPADAQRDLVVGAEWFRDWEDYHRQWVSQGMPGGLIGGNLRSDHSFRKFDDSLPRISWSEYEEIVSAIRSGERELHRGKTRSKARLLVEDHLDAYDSAVRKAFGLTQGRAKAPEDRLRTISGLQYAGLSYEKAVKRWNREHPDDAPLDPDTVGREVRRFRRGCKNVSWGLRVMILRLGFPEVCPTCKGSREVPNRQLGDRRSRTKSDPELETSRPGTVPCADCGGTGRRKFPSN